MDDQLVTLSKIFTERIFRIPDYQRGYAWTEKQLKDFWSDLQQLDHRANHYTGVLTLESVDPSTYETWDADVWIVEAKSYRPYFVVDGQQRLTTSIVLIQAIIESIGEDEKLNFTEKSEIQKKFIFESKDGGISRSYIFGYEKDNPSYEYLKTKVFNERSGSNQSEETIYTQNLRRAKEYFAVRISELDKKDVEILYRKVTQQLLFNTFTITQEVEVCVAFETMNNRGKPLSYLELLKNRLIYLSLKFNVDDDEKSALRTCINLCWKDIYHNLGRNKDKPLDDDEFLLTHSLTYFGTDAIDSDLPVPLLHRSLYRSTEHLNDLLEQRFIARNIAEETQEDRKVTLRKIYDYVSSLQDSVQVWYKMSNPLQSDFSSDVKAWLDKLNRIGLPGVDALVLVYLQKETSNPRRIEFLKLLERSIFLFILGLGYLSAYRSTRLPDQLIKLAMQLGTGRVSVEKVVKTVRELGDEIAKNSSALTTSEFSTSGFYGWVGLRYFLYEYNLSLHDRSKTDRQKIFWPEFTEPLKDFLTVEHIYPRQARTKSWASAFSAYNQKQRNALRESLGNLLPLSKPKNSSLSNRPFIDKKNGIGDSSIGYTFGCYAENEVAKETDWTPELILARGVKMLSFMEKRWDIKFGGDAAMKKMLGLAFM
jgi:hypothetical protein